MRERATGSESAVAGPLYHLHRHLTRLGAVLGHRVRSRASREGDGFPVDSFLPFHHRSAVRDEGLDGGGDGDDYGECLRVVVDGCVGERVSRGMRGEAGERVTRVR